MFRLNKKESKRLVGLVSYLGVTELKIKGNNYFIKPDDNLKEVIGYYLAKSLGLNCIEYFSIKVGNKRYSISRDINELCPFVIAETLVKECFELPIILEIFDEIGLANNDLIKDILKMYIYDLLFLNEDRHSGNWGLVKEKEIYKLILYDNQNLFTVLYPPFIRFNNALFKKNVDRSVITFNNVYKDLDEFLKWCPCEYKEDIYKMIEQASISNIERIFSSIERKYDIKINSEFLVIYSEHYKKVLDVMNRNRGLNNAR